MASKYRDQINLRVDEEIREQLQGLAEREAVSASEWVRRAIVSAYQKPDGNVKRREPQPCA